jgi:hypothetical protein
MLETILLSGGERDMDVLGLKDAVRKVAPEAKTDEDFDRLEAELLKKFSAEILVAKPAEKPGETPPPTDDKDAPKDEKKDDKKAEAKEPEKAEAKK